MDAMQDFFGWTWPGVWTLAKIVAIAVPLIISVAYLTLAERKVIGWIQVRIGPNRVGPLGLLQPFADVFKLIFKEIIVPTGASRYLFFIAPILSIGPALAAWAVIPFADGLVLSDINAGLLYVLALSSMGVYGVILAGWASNSKYAFLGALRSAAQMVSYEVALGFSIIGVLMLSGSLSLVKIVEAQKNAGFWYVFLQPVGFILFFVCGVAETNRAPFDLPEAESELVAGFHTEYSGFRFSLFFLAEYANMLTVAMMAVTLFWGGWMRPFPNVAALGFLDVIPGVLWFIAKVIVFLYFYLWFRASWPRYRYDQLMKIGWQYLLPISMANVIVTAVLVLLLQR